MINNFLKFKTKNLIMQEPTLDEISSAKKILFSLFTRYGDTIITLSVIKEFIEKYPNKQYLILAPRQMVAYIQELLPDIEYISVNKRNLFDMLKVNYRLKKEDFDIGFNPWSNGIDSCYFISYCKKFLCYKDFQRPEVINHYEVVRKYLKLPSKSWQIDELKLKDNYKNILICPQSTDQQRSIDGQKLDDLIASLKSKYSDCDITIATMDKSYLRDGSDKFIFSKSAKSSSEFISLVKYSDLVLCADSGPLHIATVLKKDTVALFSITKPEIVINTGSKIKVNL